ncbi:hypothetical protein PhCBS80983_g00809 [Powellomyces hirtus]|uniref:U3 small nucleolar RNA-associated protein 10 n=1 Tax=Powellomyces hirtus TaxID=109895 RepID=A0A507EDJ8_9FUNG|nr:hypothetical protein PhCBS80983_g00809 [Powellomyces hirtus]
MASSSLAAQLQKLGSTHIPGTHKGKASLLFSAKQAADIDIDSLFAIGHNALDDLATHNPAFLEFEQTLFSEKIKTFDRTLQTKEDNAKLDETISQFLRLLSPHFLVQSSFKALEWLLRRFRINEFNVDHLMECVLPYHETKQFVQVVGVLAIQETSRWAFLKPLQKTKVPLDRTSLVQRLGNDKSLLEFVCGMTTSSKAHGIINRTLWTFFACTIIQYVQDLHTVADEDIRILLAPLLSLVRIGNPQYADLLATSQMIFAQISNRSALNNEVVSAIVENAVAGVTPANLNTSIIFLLTIYRTQSIEVVPVKAFAKLLVTSGFEACVAQISITYEADNLLCAMLASAISAIRAADQRAKTAELAQHFVEEVFSKAQPAVKVVTFLATGVLDAYLEIEDSESGVMDRLGALLASVQRSHAGVVDKIIEAKLKSAEAAGNTAERQALYEFVSGTYKGTEGAVVKDANTTLYLSLQHVDSRIRLMALKKLEGMLTSGETKGMDYLEDMLLSRLQDDDNEILKKVLSLPKFSDLVQPAKLLPALRTILRVSTVSAKNKIMAFDLCSALVKSVDEEEQKASSLDLLGCFLLTKANRKLNNHAFTAQEKKFVLADLVKGSKKVAVDLGKLGDKADEKALAEITAHIVSLLAGNLKSANEANLNLFIEGTNGTSLNTRILCTLVIVKALTTKTGEEQLRLANTLVAILLSKLRKLKTDLHKVPQHIAEVNNGLPSGALFKDIVKMKDGLSNDALEAEISFSALQNIVASVPKCAPIAWITEATEGDESIVLYRSLISTLYQGVSAIGSNKACDSIILNIIDRHLGKDTIQFCAALWIDNDAGQPYMKHHSLVVAAAYINACVDPTVATKYDFQLLIPSVLIALSDSDKQVRHGALVCLEAMKSAYVKSSGDLKAKKKSQSQVQIFAYDQFYGESSEKVQYLTTESAAKFVNALLEGTEELLTDAGFLQRYIQSVLAAKGEKKSGGYKEDVLSFLLTNILAFPQASAQVKLLNMLEAVDASLKIKTMHPLLESSLRRVSVASEADAKSEQLMELICALLKCFTPAVNVSLFKMRNDKYVRLYCQMLDSVAAETKASAANQAAVQSLALKQIDSKWFTGLPTDRQSEFFSAIVRLAYEGETEVVQDAKHLLKVVPITWELILNQLQMCQAILEATAERPMKKNTSGNTDLTDAFYRLSTVLEMMEYKHDIESKHNLVGPLFDLLNSILNAELSNIPVSIEYVKQLIFSVTLSLFKDIKKNGLEIDEATLRVELIVQCIRVTDNPQTHNASLLLMATIATVYPESVLLNIMPVFTFMGANVLRQDDNYSFHVIQQTLKTVIPPLVQRYQAEDGSRITMLREVKPIMGVFVDALTHIPKHRRLRLFTELITTLGADTFLDAIVLMLLAKHSAKNKLPAHGIDGLMDFILSVVSQFPIKTQLHAITAMIETVSALPVEQVDAEAAMDVEESSIIDPKSFSAKELRQIKLSTVEFINQLLSSKSFIANALLLSREEIEEDQMTLIQETLVFITNVNAYQAASESRGHSVGVKFAKAMNKLLYDALGRANGLLSLSSFLTVTSRLMKHENHAIRRKAITLLDAKVAAVANDIDENMLPEFAVVVGDLRQTLVSGQADDEEVLENKQTALLCLTTMARIMAKADPDTYIAVLQLLVGDETLQNDNAQIVASTMVCLTSICMELGSRVLPFLPKFMPGIIRNLKNALAEKETSETKMLVILGSLGSLDALVDTVPQFISPYVLPILQEALHPTLLQSGTEGVGRRAADKSNELLSNMATKIAPRVLLPAMFAHLKISLQSGRQSMLALFDLVGKAIAHMPRTELTQYRTELFRFFLVSFDYRRTYASKVSNEDVEAVENSIISAFLQLVMKLNETLFKPLFLKMVDWATSELLLKHGLTQEDVNARQLFFYRLVDSLLARLKSIFAPYYAYVLDNSVAKLEAYKKTKRTDALWTYIVMSLHKCFLYDNDNLIDADKFDKLLQPLISQIDSLDLTDKQYSSNMTQFLVPCIGQLAVTVGRDSLWKPLNHQVLMKTRSEQPAVRLIALRVLQELYARLGEEMLILFPETIPFLAELMEDTDGEVEKACQNVCSQIQQFIGEDIQQYFTA